MTSTINFTDLKQKMELLKELHVAFRADVDGDVLNEAEWMTKRNRYVALRREVSNKLMPLFEDLQNTEMLILWTHGPVVDNHNHATTQNLEVNGENSGIQMSVKKN